MDRLNKNVILALADEINQALFNGALDLGAFKIIQQKRHFAGWMGEYFNGKIKLGLDKHENYLELLETLAHEMTHYYQDSLGLPTNHNGAFFRYYSKKWAKIQGFYL